MKDFWENRYLGTEYAYGVSPNEFFAQQLLKLSAGNLLLPAEGEGRNAVFAALNMWHVNAFDISPAAKDKAGKLANEKNVRIAYEICTYDEYKAPAKFFDCIGLIFTHMPSEARQKFYTKIAKYLKPGGTIILQAFSKAQLGLNSGGPNDIDWLLSVDELKEDFKQFSNIQVEETQVVLNEGVFHQGPAQVVQLVATL